MRSIRIWTNDEIDYIRKNSDTLSTAEMSSYLNRTQYSVRSKVEKLGLTPVKKRRKRSEFIIDTGYYHDIKPKQHAFDLKVGDVITAPYRSKSADYVGKNENVYIMGTKICKYTVTAIYPHIFQARLEETSDAGVIRELTKNAYISGEIKKCRSKQ